MSNHFDRLGLPRRFVLDAAELERQYLARSRAVHPDFHAAGASSDLAASLELSAALNEAYNTLRDPFTRAEYLLGLEGGPAASEHKNVPPEFLAEMLEFRERIEEARAGGNTCLAAVAELDTEFTGRLNALMAEVGRHFDQLDRLPAGDPKRADIRLDIRKQLNAAKYVRGLIRDLHAD
jgi:molecular chaperone HscB